MQEGRKVKKWQFAYYMYIAKTACTRYVFFDTQNALLLSTPHRRDEGSLSALEEMANLGNDGKSTAYSCSL